jgi:hypothetical protein
VVKKRVTPKRAARKNTPKKPGADKRVGSRIDLKPLQRHIRKRIEELENRRTAGSGPGPAGAPSDDETIERLRAVLETLEDICFPAMDIPI